MKLKIINRLASDGAVAVLCIAAGAIMLRLAHPPLGLFPAAFLAWPFLFEGLRRSGHPLAAGMAFGALYSMAHVSWMMETLLVHYSLVLPLALLFFTVFTGIIPSLAWLLFAVAARGVITRAAGAHASIKGCLFSGVQIAAAFTVCEWLRKSFSPEHGWGEVAASFAGVPEFFGIAPLTGAGGVAFTTVFCGFLLWTAFILFGRGDRRRGMIFIALAILASGSLYLAGCLRHYLAAGEESGARIRAVIVHPGIRQSQRWRGDLNASILAHYRRMSLEAFGAAGAGTERRLIVWPETAVTMALEGNPEFRQALTDIARQTGAWILLGAPSFRGDGGDRRYYNSVYLIDPSGNIAGRYDKIYLLPFAERRFALLELMSEHDSGLYTRGENITPLVMGGPGGEGGAGVPIGAFICYEAGIPSLAGSLARRGARFFANISNDAWFGESAESLQQIAMLQVRCAEFGVPAVRSSGWGVAAVVDRRGRVVSSTDIGGETSLRAEISVSAGGLSPYARFQGWFEIACALLLLGAFYRRGRNTVDEKPREG